MRVDEVFLPERVRRRGLMRRNGELRILDRFDRQEHLAEQSAGGLPGVRCHLERRERQEWRKEPDTNRVPAQGIHTEAPALGPAAHEEQRVGRVGSQEVAVAACLAGALGLGDSFVGDRDRLVAAPEKVENRGQVGIDAE